MYRKRGATPNTRKLNKTEGYDLHHKHFSYYRDLYKYEAVRQRATETLKRNRPQMHMITAKMVAEDLHLNEQWTTAKQNER